MIRVIRDESGFFFVHYLIEPKKLSIEQYDTNFFANLEINGSVLDSNDKMIYQFTKSVPIKLDNEQLDKIKSKLFSFQDIFPLIEGKYKVNILIRNVVSKEFTSIEREVTIPKIEKPQISALTLAHTAKKDPKYRHIDKGFLVNDVQLLPSPRNDFVTGDTLYVYFQLYGFTDEQIKKGHINYTLYKNDKAVHTVKKNLKDYPDKTNILEEFSLEGYSAAYYNIRASVYANESQFLVLGEESFYISPIKHLPRAWVVSISSPANSPENLNKMGIQYVNSNNDQKALEYLEKAYNRNPVSVHLALDYCRILNKLKMYQKVLIVGGPFMETEEKNKFYALMGLASEGLGQYEEAIKYFKDYLSYHGANLRILNLIGTCYHKLGNIEEALIAWEKSLELLPKQEKLKAFVESLKKNRKKKLP
jgi:tetratricopeptide (TPR) repeat protein